MSTWKSSSWHSISSCIHIQTLPHTHTQILPHTSRHSCIQRLQQQLQSLGSPASTRIWSVHLSGSWLCLFVCQLPPLGPIYIRTSKTNVCCCPTYPHTHRSQHNFASKFETQHTTLWGFHYQMSSWLTSRNSRFIRRISRQKTHFKDFRLWKVDYKIFTKDFP